MAKIRSLPDKFYDKDYEHNGIHRVPLWRIAGYALNNTATNVYLMMMNYATYYLMGWVGVGMMVASSLTMMMRMWDGVTDPFIGYFRNLYIFGQPAEFVSVVTKIASGVTLVNSLLSTVCAVVLYIALRPALEKAHLLPKE